MKHYLITVLLCYTTWGFSQNIDTNISLSFDNASIKQVIQLIEEKTDYTFYYMDSWFDKKTFSGAYRDTDIETILGNIFQDTVFNFYIFKTKKIILSPNTIIYANLPDNFFGDSIHLKTEIVTPVLRQKRYKPQNQKIQALKIGKQDRNSNRRKYTLTGKISNQRNGKPIANMVVSVKDININTETDQSGFYSLELPLGKHILEIKSIVFKNIEKPIIIYNDGQLDIDLNENLEVLDEVILSLNNSKNVSQAVLGKEKIDVEESKNIPVVLGERDVLKIATALPGITSVGEGASGYNVRGGKSDQNLILLDDAVIYNPQHFFGLFSGLNPFTIGEVSIYKGSIPAQYGGRLSSVFDIKTKNGNTEKITGEASIGPVTSNVEIELPIIKNKSSLLIGGRGAYANWILRSVDQKSLKNSQASFYDVIAKYKHTIDKKNTLNTTAYFSRDNFSITSDSTYTYKNQLFSAKWNHHFNDYNIGSLLLANSTYKFDIKFDGETNTDFDLRYSINETALKLKVKSFYNKNLEFDYGISGKFYNVNPGSKNPLNQESTVAALQIPKERAIETAAFISANLKASKSLVFDVGIRYSFYAALGESQQNVFRDDAPRNNASIIETINFEKNEVIKTYGNPEVRASARYLLNPDLSIKASYNNSFQYIHTLSNNTTSSPIDTWKLSDLNIKPQKSTLYSLGVYKDIHENKYELSLEGFYKQFDNIVDFKIGSQILLNESIETQVLQGKGKSYGVEFLIKKNKGKLNGWIGYTYSRAFNKIDSRFAEERIDQGRYFPANFDKPHDISLVANYKFTKRYSLSTNFVYQTGRPVTFPVGQFQFNGSQFTVFSDRNTFRVPDYYRLDIGLNIEGNHKIKKFAHSFWTISVYNVLGRNNPYSVFFVTEDGVVKSFKSSVFAVPIPAITYNFKF